MKLKNILFAALIGQFLSCTNFSSEEQVKEPQSEKYMITYYPEGQIKEIYTLKDGLCNGTKVTYFLTGLKYSIETFDLGKLDGISMYYGRDNSVAKVENYENGMMLNQTIYNHHGNRESSHFCRCDSLILY